MALDQIEVTDELQNDEETNTTVSEHSDAVNNPIETAESHNVGDEPAVVIDVKDSADPYAMFVQQMEAKGIPVDIDATQKPRSARSRQKRPTSRPSSRPVSEKNESPNRSPSPQAEQPYGLGKPMQNVKGQYAQVWKPGFQNRRNTSDYLKHSFPAGFQLKQAKNKILGPGRYHFDLDDEEHVNVILSPGKSKFSFHQWTKGVGENYDDSYDEQDEHGDPYMDVAGPLLRDLHRARVTGDVVAIAAENDPACSVSRVPLLRPQEEHAVQLRRAKVSAPISSASIATHPLAQSPPRPKVFHAPSALPALPLVPALIKPYDRDASQPVWLPPTAATSSTHRSQLSVNSSTSQLLLPLPAQQQQAVASLQQTSRSLSNSHAPSQQSAASSGQTYEEWLAYKRSHLAEQVWKQRGNDTSYNYSVHSFDGQPTVLDLAAEKVYPSPIAALPAALPASLSLEIYTLNGLRAVTEKNFQEQEKTLARRKELSSEESLESVRREIVTEIIRDIQAAFQPPLASLLTNHVDKVNAARLLAEDAAALQYASVDQSRVRVALFVFSPEQKIWRPVESEADWVRAKHAAHLYRQAVLHRQRQLQEQQALEQRRSQLTAQPLQQSPHSGQNSRAATGRLRTPKAASGLLTTSPPSPSQPLAPAPEDLLLLSEQLTVRLMYTMEPATESYLQAVLRENYQRRRELLEKDRMNLSLRDLTDSLEKDVRRRRKRNLLPHQLLLTQPVQTHAVPMPAQQSPQKLTKSSGSVVSVVSAEQSHELQGGPSMLSLSSAIGKKSLRGGSVGASLSLHSASHSELPQSPATRPLPQYQPKQKKVAVLSTSAHLVVTDSLLDSLAPAQTSQQHEGMGGISGHLQADRLERQLAQSSSHSSQTFLMAAGPSILYPKQSPSLKKLQEDSQRQVVKLQSFAEQLQDRLLKTKF
jgi:hypothetical protein